MPINYIKRLIEVEKKYIKIKFFFSLFLLYTASKRKYLKIETTIEKPRKFAIECKQYNYIYKFE